MSKQSKTPSKLVVVESPAKAKTINRILGDDFRVEASMGHVRDLPPRRLGIDIAAGFKPEYQVAEGRKKTVDHLRKLAKESAEVYLATDLDREGEAIAWHLAEALKLPTEKVRRVVFNEITASAVRGAFSHPGVIDSKKVDAQQARRLLDRIVGYMLSPLLWKKVTGGLSAGRVQSVAVKLIVDRERQVDAFEPTEYWRLIATLGQASPRKGDPPTFEAELNRLAGRKAEIGSGDQANELVTRLSKATYVVSKVVETERTPSPPPPFATSTLQQQASTRLGFSAQRTMRVAQQLYEGVVLGREGSVGLITYMRTDSFRVADAALDECRQFIEETYGKDHLPDKPRRFRSPARAQAAHEAVRPTYTRRTPDEVKPHLSRDQHRLYELIWSRFVASQMKEARYLVTRVEITAEDALYVATGRRLLFAGHLALRPDESRKEQALPHLAEGETLNLKKLDPSQHFTQPPPRYTEATLVRTLEKLGIGRPSTYAPIISTIKQRHYVETTRRTFFPTDLGKLVTQLLVKHFPDIMDEQFTSAMEKRLDDIEEEGKDWRAVLAEYYEPFKADLDKAKEEMKSVRKEPEKTDEISEKCEKPMVIRWSKTGRFLACSGFPACRNTRSLPSDGEETPEPEIEVNETCEKCGKEMRVRHGPRGRFLGCAGFPACRNTKPLPGQKPAVVVTDEVCEECGEKMILRHGRRGAFLGCSGYPKCRNTKPTPKEKSE